MSKEKTNNFTVPIVVAIIGLFGTCITAFFAVPAFQAWVGSLFATSNPKVLTMEQLPYTIYPFDGRSDEDPNCCKGAAYFKFSNLPGKAPDYGLDYDLSGESSRFGYAGFAFVFTASQDLSSYDAIQFTILFGGETTRADMNFQDISKLKMPYHIYGIGQPDIKVIVPLSYFKGIDLHAIRSIGFQVDSSLGQVNSSFHVKDIQLTRK